MADLADISGETAGNLGCQLTIEPGRSLVAKAGLLVTQVLYTKVAHQKNIAIVDVGMNDLMRPALYDVVHSVIPVLQSTPNDARHTYQVVGPVCECIDVFGTIHAGAYGAAMSSTYNARPLVPEILVDEGRYKIVRRRQTIEEMMRLEQQEQWVTATSSLADIAPRTQNTIYQQLAAEDSIEGHGS